VKLGEVCRSQLHPWWRDVGIKVIIFPTNFVHNYSDFYVPSSSFTLVVVKRTCIRNNNTYGDV